MVFHVIVTCVSQKRVPRVESIADDDIKKSNLSQLYEQWISKLENSNLPKIKAIDLYQGDLWNKYIQLYKLVSGLGSAKLWVISAGHGLIEADSEVVPYAITFQREKHIHDSLFNKLDDAAISSLGRKNILREWWKKVTSGESKTKICELLTESPPEDNFLFVLGNGYLEAILPDLNEGIYSRKSGKDVIIISNSKKTSETKDLGQNLLFYSPNFRNLPGTNSVTVNASIAIELVKNVDSTNFLPKPNISELNLFLQELSSTVKVTDKIDRDKSSDDDVYSFIKSALEEDEVSGSILIRKYRDMGKACEQKRFMGIYREVVNDLKKNNSRTKGLPPFTYNDRKGSILFFIPDNDDRVDPDYDFINEKSRPFRDVYRNDAYHYELYGSLNCDGMLVSKGVLEASKEKRKLAEDLGIHGFLRLPEEVPIIGDCGAFSYIFDENPPYETNEILDYYHRSGFNYGVSIDHLIIPAVYTKYNHFHFQNGTIRSITEDEFNKLHKEKALKIIKSVNHQSVNSLFNDEFLIKEEYLDENERDRRYRITMENGINFIKGHRQKGYAFEPIGAVQGWDPQSYAEMAEEFQKQGYRYIALGSLVRSRNEEIIATVDEVNKTRQKDTRLHVFGVGRKDLIKPFLERNVTSVDNAGILRQAWLSSTNNYYAKGFNNYSAIRVPIFNENNIKNLLDNNYDIPNLEKQTLDSLRLYDRDEIDIHQVLEIVTKYNRLMHVPEEVIATYRRTLEDKPWKQCPCTICRETGIEVVIFRGNNRNRRRGFHNTWFFYQWLKEQ